MEYIERILYIAKEEFDYLEFVMEQSNYFKETYPDYRSNSIGVYESDYDIDTFEILVRFEYELFL